MARRGITASAVAVVLVPAAADPAGAVSQAPAYRGAFPDPSVLRLGRPTGLIDGPRRGATSRS
jgi:hypothetical protein